MNPITKQFQFGDQQVSIETNGSEDDVSSGYNDVWSALTSGQGVVAEQVVFSTTEEQEEQDLFDDILG